jgi:hypothetical protein
MKADVGPSRWPDFSDENEVVRQIIEAVRSVRFGQVQIIIQDSRVVQIDKTEKIRLT